jgi:hypothetical protein
LDVSTVTVADSVDVKDTPTLITEYVGQLDINNKDEVASILHGLYLEAQTIMR